MKVISLLVLAVWLACIVGWCMNLYKFVTLNFESPYKAEVIRGVGVFTGIGAVTGYINIKD